MDETVGELQWHDYLIVVIALSVSASMGVYFRFSGGRQKTTEEYFTANRSMNVPLLAIAIMVSFVSAISMLGVSGENYIYGFSFNVILIGFCVGTPINVFFYLPVFFKLQTMSIYEYLERRFGTTARLAASLANFVQLIFSTGVVLYAPALALEASTGMSSVWSVLVIGIICTFYSSIGGMKAVIATDVIQGILMFTSILCVIGVVCYDTEGGIYEVLRRATEGDRLKVWNFDPDPRVRHTIWGCTIGGTCTYLSIFGVSQVSFQRLLSARSLKSAQVALFITLPLVAIFILIASLAGVSLYVWYKGCDPVASGQIYTFDQVMPYFAKIRMSKIPGLSGIFIAGVFSASLSTVSAVINSLAAVAVTDYIKPIYSKFGRELSDVRASLFSKILAAINGVTILGVAYIVSQIGNIMQALLAINGAMGGPILGLFSLGMFVEAANEYGSVIGVIIGLAVSLWVVFGSPKPPTPELPVSTENCPNSTGIYSSAYEARLLRFKAAEDIEYFEVYRLSYVWYPVIGLVVTMLFGYVASTALRWLGKDSIAERDPDLFTPVLASWVKKRRADALKMNSPGVFVLTAK